MKTFYIKTYGCQMNDYDSQRMVDLLTTNFKAKQVSDPSIADLLLVNTCSIREKAQEKTFSELGRWKAYKERRPKTLIGVGGCVASQEGKEIIKRAPYIDLVFGPQTLHRLPELIAKAQTSRKGIVDVSFPEIEKFDKLPEHKASGVSAYVSIMEGCNKFCTYCIVPYTRGKEISRPFDDVIAETVQLALQGIKEVTFLGQNVNAYHGKTYQQFADLAMLIRYTAEIPGIERIRFTTSNPYDFSDNLVTAYATIPKLAKQLHLPVQSGSNRILSMMKRGHTIEQFLSKINALRKARAGITFSTDLIVGFPGESVEDFEATMDLVATVGFTQAFSFMYSPRPGTIASDLPNSVSLIEKKQRLAKLQTLLKQQTKKYYDSLLNSVQAILITGPSKNNPLLLSGRTECNTLVHCRGQATDIGRILPIRITEVLSNCLLGEITSTKDMEFFNTVNYDYA